MTHPACRLDAGDQFRLLGTSDVHVLVDSTDYGDVLYLHTTAEAVIEVHPLDTVASTATEKP